MTFAGIDYDSSSIDIVTLELDSDLASWHRILLDSTGGRDALERARLVRGVMPPRTAWKDAGVVTVALEDPKGPTFKGSIPIARVQGAILACLPAPGEDPDVLLLSTQEWKIAALGRGYGNCAKQAVQKWVRDTWPNLPTRAGQDALDAYAIAWAARSICERAATAA